MYQLRHLSIFLAIFVFAAGTAFGNFSFDEFDDDIPEVTDRVARIGAVSGDVRIKRLDSEEWEDARLNLPLVEGDEIATASGGLVEVQFDVNKHLRLAGGSLLKFTTLRDEGIAVSISQGTLSARILEFDLDAEFFEIDAPKTTIAVQQAGKYRIDAGNPGDTEIRVTINEGGQARIYSENAGFTLNDGRMARVFIDGNFTGEWQLADSSRFFDDFDRWVAERETVIADRLQTAHFDEYYDDSIVGAEELTNYGDWVHTTDYGYMWRPSQTAVRSYSNWSPYRYGEWRWIAPYGWTWINDEPWGWATYHYGRWVWHNNYWYWSPYGHHRYGRSIWRPALVIMSYWGSSIYWYPLPYYYSYYNYNRHYHRNRRHRPNQPRPRNPRPAPTPDPTIARRGNSTHSQVEVPQAAIISVNSDEFGKMARPQPTTLRPNEKVDILAKTPSATELPTLPIYTARTANSGAKTAPVQTPNIRTGAVPRNVDGPLDPQLQKRQILGNREPVQTPNTTQRPAPGNSAAPASTIQPRTGAVQRTTPPARSTQSPPVRNPNRQPVTQPAQQQKSGTETKQTATPTYTPPARTTTPQPQRTTPAPSTTQRTAPAPTRTTTPAPARTTTPAPARTSTPAPARTSTPAPARTSTPAPARTSTPAPARTSTPAPARTSTPAPARSTPAPARSTPQPSRSTPSRPAPSSSSSSKKDG